MGKSVWTSESATAFVLTRPRDNFLRVDVGEVLVAPADERLDPVVANVTVVPVELRSAGDAKAIDAQPRRDYLSLIIKQAHPRCSCLALLIV